MKTCNKTNTAQNSDNAKMKIRATIRRYIFFFVILFIPLAQFCIFYVGTNINTIVMSFQKYDNGVFIGNGWKNYEEFFSMLSTDIRLVSALKNSFIQYLATLIISMPLSIIIAYYLYVKIPATGFFKVMLMIPQLISSMVFVCIFKYLFNDGIIPLFGWKANIYWVAPTQFQIMLFYQLFFGLAGHLVLYLGAMANIDQSVMEYGDIDGLGTLGKLWHIVLPGIYPTIVVFMMTGFAGFFTNQGPLYSFYANTAHNESYTLGYWMFLLVHDTSKTPYEYPLASTAGVVFTAIAAPLVLLFRNLLERFGPRED